MKVGDSALLLAIPAKEVPLVDQKSNVHIWFRVRIFVGLLCQFGSFNPQYVCTGDKFTVLAEDQSDDEEDEGFEGLGTEQIMLP